MDIAAAIKSADDTATFLGDATISDTGAKLVVELAGFVKEEAAFESKGNKAAGTRARKHLIEIMRLAKTRRAEISEQKRGE